MTLSNRELGLLSNTDVLGYIQARNAEINAQAKAEGWQFWTLIAESLADEHANAYDLELRFARSTYSDVYKDWAGIRPSIPQGLTLVELEAEIDSLAKLANDAYQAEQEWLAEQKQMERDQIALGLTDSMSCGEEVVLEEWEVYENKAEEAGY